MRTLALLAVVLIAGCDSEDGGRETGDAGTVPLAARAADLAPELARTSLNGSSLAKQQLVASEAGRVLLARVVSCALPAGASITGVATDGTPYQFAGALGLAPSWADHPASARDRERITACIRDHAPAAAPAPLVGSIGPSPRRGS